MPTHRDLLAFDFETHQLGLCNVAPKIVCGSWAVADQASVVAAADGGGAFDRLLDAILDPAREPVAHNAAFDLSVVCANYPDRIPSVFRALSDGRVHCTKVREKLLQLYTTGHTDSFVMPDGKETKIRFSLAELVNFRFGVDRSDEKSDPASWRTNFAVLDGIPSVEYPSEAWDYVLADSTDALRLWYDQEERAEDLYSRLGYHPFATADLHTAMDLCLYLVSCWGVAVDGDEYRGMVAELAGELHPDNFNLLIESGILRPPVPARPYANGAKNEDGSPKMTAPKKESVNKAVLAEFVKALPGVEVKTTPPSEKFPEGQVSVDADWLSQWAHASPVLVQYQHRQSLQKLVTTELPRMCLDASAETPEPSPVVHPSFDVLKETGRTSSFASTAYPSFNCQNVHRLARRCFVSRDGYVLFSVDYSQMELVTLAQTCLRLFGYSVMADVINAGIDIHEYTGSALAVSLDQDFANFCVQSGVAGDKNKTWELFRSLRSMDSDAARGTYKHYRKFAKPTNLGYPGGLGPATFVAYARSPYGVEVDEPTARMLRELWMGTFPEMEDYFKYINGQSKDPNNEDKYQYVSPMGMLRRNATYCATANGLGLQSPAAEIMKVATFNVVRAIYDRTMRSVLGEEIGGRPVVRVVAMIHDELVGEVLMDDPARVTARVREIQRIMEAAMAWICPDVRGRTEACLMDRWDKSAEPVLDEAGNLAVWHPDPKEN